jgi:CRISPR-associated protein Csm2
MALEHHTFKEEWIKSGIKGEAILYAQLLGSYLQGERFSTSQIRNFYGELKRIQLKKITSDKHKASFHLLHPKLAYAVARANNKGANLFKTEILKAHKAVAIDQEGFLQRFENFCDLCEAILAFHKAAGGK